MIGPLVHGQISSGGEGLPTYITGMRLFAGMRPGVHCQVHLLLETLVAIAALVRSLVCMLAHV